MDRNRIDAIAVFGSLAVLALAILFDSFLSLIIGVGLMIILAALSEAGRKEVPKRVWFILVTLIMNLAVFLFLFPGNYTGGIVFALAGIGVVLFSKGHLGRALALTFLLSPILIAILLPGYALTLNGFLPGNALGFAVLALLVSTIIVITSLGPVLIFQVTDISMFRRFRLGNSASGVYWSSAFWLYVLQESRYVLTYPTLPLAAFAWVLFVIVTQEGGGVISKRVATRLNLIPYYTVTITVLDASSPKPYKVVSGAQVKFGDTSHTTAPDGTVKFEEILEDEYTLTVQAPHYQQNQVKAKIYSKKLGLEVLLTPVSVKDVTVTVLDASTRKPVSGAQVKFGGVIRSSGLSGAATFDAITAGTYSLTVDAPQYQSATIQANVSSNLALEVLLTPIPVYDVIVTVFDSTSHTPVAGARVDLDGRLQVSGAVGTVTYFSMLAGVYSLVVGAPNYQQTTLAIKVPSRLKIDVPLIPLAIPQRRPPGTTRTVKIPAQQEWPSIDEYVGAFQNFGNHNMLPNLQKGVPFPDYEGKPASWAGSNAVVFKLELGTSASAIRCFTPFPPDPEVERRCNLISEYVGYARSPVLVDFHYYKEGLTINQTRYPIVLMDWVDGLTLHSYITDNDNYSNSTKIKELARKFIDAMILLRKNRIAHGDLSSDNIMVTEDRSQGLGIKLVDYDAMYIPPFAGQLSPSKETGKPAFQHPLRTTKHYSVRMDNFSCLVIYLSLLAIGEKPKVWESFNGGVKEQRILFDEQDFANPAASKAFNDIATIKNANIQTLLNLLKAALKEDPLWEQTDPERIKLP